MRMRIRKISCYGKSRCTRSCCMYSILKLYSTYSQGQNGLNFTLFFPLRLQLSHHNCNILAGALHNCTKKVKTQTAMNGSNHVLHHRIKYYFILSQFIWSTIFSKTEKSNTNMYTYYTSTKSMITFYFVFSK